MRPDLPSVDVLGVPIARINREHALGEVEALLGSEGPAVLAYVNAHSLNLCCRNPAYREVLRRADLVLNDGSGLALAGRVHRRRFPDNLNGTDFTPQLLVLAARRNAPVFLLGGAPGVASEAAARLTAAIPGLEVVGTEHGYLDRDATSAVLERIRHSGAQVLLVGMGNPSQELWLDEYLAASGACLGVAVGAFLDFVARRVPRAPAWMRTLGVEWVFRLLREPRRLFHRYLLGNPLFVYRVLREATCRHTGA